MIFFFPGAEASIDWIGLLFQFLTPAAVPFSAAWAGAYFAFRFQNQKEEERKTTSQIEVINSTTITLSQMHKELSGYKRQIITPHLSKPLMAFTMVPSDFGDLSHLVLHSDSLSFLCETDHFQVPSNVGYTYILFRRALNMIVQRTNHHVNVIQPALAKRDEPRAPITDELIDELLTADQRGLQEGLTRGMVQYVDDVLKEIDTCAELLLAAGIALYEKDRVVTYETKYDQDKTDDG